MGIATQVDTSLTALVDGYVATYSTALCQALVPVAITSITIFLILQGWAIARGHSSDSVPTLLMRVFRIAFIASIALVAGMYQQLVMAGLIGLQDGLIQALTAQENMGAFLDDIYKPFIDLSSYVMAHGSTGVLPNWGMICASLLIGLAAVVTIVIGLGFYCLAKVAIGLLLAVGPLFISCAMFPSTQRFAESWLGQALNYALLNVLVVACVSMVMQFGAEFARRILDDPDATNILSSALALDMAVGGLLVVLLNVNQIASALTGGVTLSGVGREVAHLIMHRGRSGPSSAGNAGGSLIRSEPNARHSDPAPALPPPAYNQAAAQYARRTAIQRGTE